MIDAILKTVEDKKISKIVVASRSGKSAIRLAESVGKGVQVISVSEFTYSDDVKKRMKKLKMVPVENADLVVQDFKDTRETLLTYGKDVKSALEVALIANRSGLVEDDFLTVSGKETVLVVNSENIEEKLLSKPLGEVAAKQFVEASLIS